MGMQESSEAACWQRIKTGSKFSRWLLVAVFFTSVLMLAVSSGWSQEDDPGESRIWTSRSGKHKTRATLVEVDETHLKLKKEDGTVISVPFAKISKADLDFLAESGRISSAQASGDDLKSESQDPSVWQPELVVGHFKPRGSKKTTLMVGLPFVSKAGTDIVFPARYRVYDSKRDSELVVGIGRSPNDATKPVEYWSTQVVDGFGVTMVGHTDSLESISCPVSDSLLDYKVGQTLRLHMVTPLQGANPRIDVKSVNANIQSVRRNEGKPYAVNVSLDFPTIHSMAIATNEQREVIGIAVLPDSRRMSEVDEMRRTRGRAPYNNYKVSVFPYKRLYDPETPMVLDRIGHWSSRPDDGIEISCRFSTNLELGEGSQLRLESLSPSLSRNPRRIGEDRTLTVGKAVQVERLEADERRAGFPGGGRGDYKYLATFNVDAYPGLSMPGWVAKMQLIGPGETGGETQSGRTYATLTCVIPPKSDHLPYPFAEIASEVAKKPEQAFRKDLRLTQEQYQYSYVDSEWVAPETKTTSFEGRNFFEEEAAGTLFCDWAKHRSQLPAIGSLVFSEDQSIAYGRADGSVVRIDLNDGRITHQCQVGGRRQNNPLACSITREGVLVSCANGLLLLDAENLEKKTWIPGLHCKMVAGAASSPFAFVVDQAKPDVIRPERQTASLVVIDTVEGRPIFRIPAVFPDLPVEPYYSRVQQCGIYDLQMSRDGKYLYVRWNRFVSRIRVDGSELVFEERSPSLFLERDRRISISHDGQFIATAKGRDGSVEIHHAADFSAPVSGESLNDDMVFVYDSNRKRFIRRYREYGLKQPVFPGSAHVLPKLGKVVVFGKRTEDSLQGMRIMPIPR